MLGMELGFAVLGNELEGEEVGQLGRGEGGGEGGEGPVGIGIFTKEMKESVRVISKRCHLNIQVNLRIQVNYLSICVY